MTFTWGLAASEFNIDRDNRLLSGKRLSEPNGFLVVPVGKRTRTDGDGSSYH